MCNNIRMNQLKKEEKERVVRDKISDWLEDRNGLEKNKSAIEKEESSENEIVYVSGHPLKLNNGTRVHKITSEDIDDKYKTICIKFVFEKTVKECTTSIKRFKNDSLKDVENFLANSQSIFQLRNIDLNYD